MARSKTTPWTLGKYFYHKRGRPPISKLVQGMAPPPAAESLGVVLRWRIAGDHPHPVVKKVRARFESHLLLKWVRGKARPSYEEAFLLEELTQGEVKLVDWVVPAALALLRKEPNPCAEKKWAATRVG